MYNAPNTAASAAANASSSANAYSSGGSNTYSSAVPTGSTVYSAYTGAGNANAYGGVDYNAQMSKTISDLEAQYRDLYNRQTNGDYTKTPYYETIRQKYGLEGDNAANAEAATSAGSNAGNLDSYAAANARRQRLAYENAAQTAALNAYNSEINNMLQTLSQLGVNVNDLYDTWSGDLNSQRDYASDLAGYDKDRYVSDNSLKGTMYTADSNLAGTQYKADADLAGTRYKADTDYAGTVYKADTDYDTALANNQSAYALQDLKNQGDYAVKQLDNDIKELQARYDLLKQEGINESNQEVQRLKNEIEDKKSERDYIASIYKVDNDTKYNELLSKYNALNEQGAQYNEDLLTYVEQLLGLDGGDNGGETASPAPTSAVPTGDSDTASASRVAGEYVTKLADAMTNDTYGVYSDEYNRLYNEIRERYGDGIAGTISSMARDLFQQRIGEYGGNTPKDLNGYGGGMTETNGSQLIDTPTVNGDITTTSYTDAQLAEIAQNIANDYFNASHDGRDYDWAKAVNDWASKIGYEGADKVMTLVSRLLKNGRGVGNPVDPNPNPIVKD